MKVIRNTIHTAAAMSILLLPQIASACPTCKDGLHNDGMAAAYAISILFMMGMPFMILTFWTVTIVRLRRKANELA